MFEGMRWLQRHNDMMHDMFSALGDYSKQYDVEKRSWEMGDAV
jgi:hypothetical protein